MSGEEERLARLLKQSVPEPPVRLSADQIMTRSDRTQARSWRRPALAAAAVVAIGVGVAVVAAQLPGGHRATPSRPLAAASAAASPQVGTSCSGRTVTVPNVVGVSMNAAIALIQDAGLTAGVYDRASTRVAPGTVVSQSLPAGGRAVLGAEVDLAIAVTQPSGTATPIDPGFENTASSPASPCQAVTGTPAPADATRPVPSVVGMTAIAAAEAALADGFSVSRVVSEPPASHQVAPGTVFAQVPAAGTGARPGSGIIMYVAPAGG
jgi:PASTA domain